MSPNRRQAAAGLMATGIGVTGLRLTGLGMGGLGASSAAAGEPEDPAPVVEHPDEDGTTRTELATRESAYEHMLAPVSINGHGPFSFLLDTGANVSCVSNRLSDQLALRPVDSAPVHTLVGVSNRPIVHLDNLRVGPRERRNVKAPSLPIKGADVDGVLGVDWLKGQRLTLDFKGRRMLITESQGDRNQPGKTVVVPARRRKGQLTIIDADLSGRRISAIIDSGAQGTLCNGRLRDLVRAQEKRSGRREPPRMVRMETLAGEPFYGESVFLPFLRLGGLHLGNVPVTCADMHVFRIWNLEATPALVLGIDLLSQFEQVAMDFGRSRVRFDFKEA